MCGRTGVLDDRPPFRSRARGARLSARAGAANPLIGSRQVYEPGRPGTWTGSGRARRESTTARPVPPGRVGAAVRCRQALTRRPVPIPLPVSVETHTSTEACAVPCRVPSDEGGASCRGRRRLEYPILPVLPLRAAAPQRPLSRCVTVLRPPHVIRPVRPSARAAGMPRRTARTATDARLPAARRRRRARPSVATALKRL